MLIPIDFEFHSSNEPRPHLVCAAVGTQGYDLEDSNKTTDFLNYMESIKGETLVAYYAVAEARCLHALGINPMDYKWVDLYAEWCMMQNSKDEFAYGNYVDKGGCIKYASSFIYIVTISKSFTKLITWRPWPSSLDSPASVATLADAALAGT